MVKEADEFSRRYFNLVELAAEDKIAELSDEELLALYEEAMQTENEYRNLGLVVKTDANSLYGTTGSVFFSLGDFDSAEDITQSGKHYAVIVDTAINMFFVNWGDNELKIIQEFYPQVTELRKFTEYKANTVNDICVYGDTDSRYLDIDMVYDFMGISLPPNTPEGNKELTDFAKFLMNKFINKVIKDTIEEDVKYRHGNLGRLKMAHEVTTRKSIFQAKKKYVMNTVWKDGKLLKKNKIKYTGVEIKKGELNGKLKKIIQVLLEKFIEEKYGVEEIRVELIKLINYIKSQHKKDFIYKISSVSGLNNITFDGNKYVSEKGHFQMQGALFWYNFVHSNKLESEYRFPFERQKMNFYKSKDKYGEHFFVAVPDDIEIDSVKGLPEPDYDLMLNELLVKPILRYIKKFEKVELKHCENFLLGIQDYL